MAAGDFEFTLNDTGYTAGQYGGKDAHVTIPSSYNGKKVTAVGKWAFYYKKDVKSVTIPSSVTRIEDFAFKISGLESVVVPNSVNYVGQNAFEGCLDLKSATLPRGLKRISRYTFWQCPLDSVVIPETVTVIEDHAFYECKSLESITIPSAVKEIGDGAFLYCGALTRAHFESPDGWYLAAREEDGYGQDLDGEDLAYPKEAARLLTSIFRYGNIWKKR
ncbi:MAG: leucine-rich repeat domain-containing protein [Clostridiales bacterium]|nr:leucine-rich repeat domain-containing protein [Clostridiales bacterium]